MEVERSAVPFIIKAIKTSESSSAGAAAAAPPQRPPANSAKHYPITASQMEEKGKEKRCTDCATNQPYRHRHAEACRCEMSTQSLVMQKVSAEEKVKQNKTFS